MRTCAFQVKTRTGQAGQAVVEYILILVVTVTIILGVLYQLNSAFRVFADSYFGDYLVCILETGEVPALGGTATGECGKELKDFNTALGEVGASTPTGGGADDSTSGDGNGNEGNNNGGSSAARGNGNLDRAALIPAGSSGGRRSGRAARFRAGRGGGGGSGDGGGGSSEIGVVAVDTNSSQSRTDRIEIRQPDTVLSGGRRVKKKKDESTQQTKVASKAADDTPQQRQALIPIQRKTSSDLEAPEIEEFGFGNILRYLIIAIIIIVIVVVIGGEVRQVQKSME